jgi:DNA repair photolyase
MWIILQIKDKSRRGKRRRRRKMSWTKLGVSSDARAPRSRSSMLRLILRVGLRTLEIQLLKPRSGLAARSLKALKRLRSKKKRRMSKWAS